MLGPLAFALLGASVAHAANFDVSVGANSQLRYDPEFVTAQIGDTVTFHFNPKNHTVTQSSFAQPCTPLAGGTDSQFMPVQAGQASPTFMVTVTDTNPLWFHCKQPVGNHCGNGMVFAINPPTSGNTFSAFQMAAEATLNSTTTSTAAATATESVWSTPSPQSFATATATVTNGTSIWTTTYTSYAGSLPPSIAPQPVNHMISVGANGFTYTPPNITAAIGDTVTFEFHPKNHTVTQSSFSNPCVPLQQSTGNVGFNSGFNPVSADATTFPTFTITINDTAPIWGYCGQTGHCAAGMVFSINAVESGPNNFENFVELAKRTGTNATAAAPAPSASTTSNNSGSGLSASHVSFITIPFLILGAVMF